MSLRSLLAVTLIISLSSCTTQIKYVNVELPLPPPLAIDWEQLESDLMCVPDSAYDTVVKMDKRIITLENIIKSTHSEK